MKWAELENNQELSDKIAALRHDDNESKNHACFNNYYFVFLDRCSFADLTPDENAPWKKK